MTDRAYEEALRKIEDCYENQDETLDLSGLKLEKLPPEIGKLQNLSQLNLHSNPLSALPAEIVQLQNLLQLNLAANQLRVLPAEVVQLQNLSQLNLAANQLRVLPAEVIQLQNLSVLSLSSNPLSALPAEIGQLQNLSELYLSDNPLSTLPVEIGQLKNLSELDLSGNQLSTLPAEIGQLKNLSTLGLSDNPLSTLPAEIGQLQNLSVLDLNDNLLSALPAEIGQLQNLSELGLSGNRLSALPAEIIQLQNLSTLDLSGNPLSTLPAEIVQLQDLSELGLSGNQLSALPTEIGQLQNLSTLSLSLNQLSVLPAEVIQLQNLSILDLRSNQLTALPAEIVQLQNLSVLDLSDNPLSALPPELLQLGLAITWKKWYELDEGEMTLKDNPLVDPPVEIVKQGNDAIAAYFAAKDKQPLNEVKVLLVGDGSAGKTSLLRRLVGEAFNPKESQTHGINIKPFTVKARSRSVVLNYWDFGGQEVMHHTHQFFLSKRSVYLLVLDGRKEEKPEYWLNYVRTLGGDSPVLVVLNKTDQNPGFEVNQASLKRKFPSIFGFFRVSCKRRSGLAYLRKALYKAMFEVEMLETHWPVSWFAVKQALVALDKPFIGEDEYVALCEDKGVVDSIAQDTLVEFLHQLGTVVHFEDLSLCEMHVLEPHWVTEAVYRIITHPQLAADKGVLRERNLPVLLKGKAGEFEYQTGQIRHYVVELMKKFELCYALGEAQLLVPDLLPVSEPEFAFDEDNALRFVFVYQFLPRSIFPRFIVKRHRDILDGWQWRTGVVLADEKTGSTALVRGDMESRKIEVLVSGERKREYFAVIRDTLWAIHDSFEVDKLGIEERIPLPGFPEHTVKYSELLGLETMRIDTLPVGELGKVFSVKQLLNGVRGATREQVFRGLETLSASGFEKVCLLFGMPAKYMRQEVTGAQKITDLIRYAEQRPGKLEHLIKVIDRVEGTGGDEAKPVRQKEQGNGVYIDMRGSEIKHSVVSAGARTQVEQNNKTAAPVEFETLVEALKTAINASADDAQKLALQSQLPALEQAKDRASVEAVLGLIKVIAGTMEDNGEIVEAVGQVEGFFSDSN